jgi:uncharacterized protein YifN (PemK superfamily)
MRQHQEKHIVVPVSTSQLLDLKAKYSSDLPSNKPPL